MATTLVDTVTSLGFQHSAVAAPGDAKPSRVPEHQSGLASIGCFLEGNHFSPGSGLSNHSYIGRHELANITDARSEFALYLMLVDVCINMSVTMRRDIVVSICNWGELSTSSNTHFLTTSYSTPAARTITPVERTQSWRR
jgi:hypothetical protein